MPVDPQTEPLPVPHPTSTSAPAAESSGRPHQRYHFTTGLRPGTVAHITADGGEILFSYTSFASVATIVSTLISAIIFVSGVAAALFLVAEGEPFSAAAAVALTIVFSTLVALLTPRVHVTLYSRDVPVLGIAQRRIFPSAVYVVTTPDAGVVAELHKPIFTRLGRNSWRIVQDGRLIGSAFEEGLGRAIVRKFAGKFSRRFETDVRIEHGGLDTARIVRRSDGTGEVDVLELRRGGLDPRLAIALATLILGREP